MTNKNSKILPPEHVFYDRLELVIEDYKNKNNISLRALSALMGIPSGQLYYYIQRAITPSADKLILFADFFGVSVDWLLGRTDRRDNNG